MAQIDPIIIREIPVIRKVIEDETWYEAQRRGCPVTSDDPVVRDNVCQNILRIGLELRDRLMAEIAAHPGPVMLAPSGDRHDQPA